MPRRIILENGMKYHIYNRGVEKRCIFMNDEDRYRFLMSIKAFNTNIIGSLHESLDRQKVSDVGKKGAWKIHDGDLVKIHAFTLLDNHFHLEIEQLVDNGCQRFLHRLMMGYTKYFNQKYNRVGPLFQGRYKSKWIDNDFYSEWIKPYIHLNILDEAFPQWREGVLVNPKKAIQYALDYTWSDFAQSINDDYIDLLKARFN